jgi:Leucine-rich repeat (LRR) protein
MQAFGLVSLLITLSLAAWWFTNSSSENLATDNNGVSNYQEIIDSAREVTGNTESVSMSNNMVFVYEGKSFPDDTTILDLSGMSLRGSLKAEIRQLKNLKVLDISNNEFTGLPAEIGQLSQLEVLNLADNPLTGLPHELGNLKSLITLDLRGTNYSTFDLEEIKKSLPSSTTVLVGN